jgi:hypothetical protein
MKKRNNIILVGASSEVAEQFIKKIDGKHNVYKISSNNFSETINSLIVTDYLDEKLKIVNFIQEIDNPYIFFFNGYISENRPKQNPDIDEINNTIKINFLIPYAITRSLLDIDKDVKKYIYISSFAAVKLRFKNFIYGQSKLLLEEAIKSSPIDNFLIIRFGKINTSMSANHAKTIFDISKESAAEVLDKLYEEKSGIVYPTILIRILSIVMIILPKKIIRILNI